ncbi:hypothetical protein DICPUDRAFT_86927 [Dictyostelium purpureum]|uniref:FZ domain-containing protein n=1 Tax=Dictyostelium purpureum TaxID=5786 RepID=F0ZEU4_DICPU|nr:uncharacterized protein DICPUDRAFT_86927 [Dictyostelium purpureum]EGC37532.1 hypothetical protein DICPUDRAFT_86927 [Dictyostelium purpureum]|eukprot:XP_003285923.1 hypothetical protein DICPUDRAFT_86927 [Dictyostelium purpureum]
MKVIFALVLLFIAFVNAQRSYPALPLVFTSDVKITTENSQMPFPQTVEGRLYYDYNAQTQRQDAVVPWQGITASKLDRFDQMNTYSYVQGQSQCECDVLTGTLPLYSVLPGSTYSGQQNIDGIDCEVWSFLLMQGVNISLYVDPSREVLVQSTMITNQNGMQFTTTMSFSNLDTSAIDSSIFEPPQFCNCPTPAPPVTPAPNACPSNPPQGCECLSSPLNFCSGVNYPITSNLGIQDTDSMIQGMFNNFVQLSQPSADCQNNMKAFLCATLIPLCISEPIPVLPCASLCPSCSCGGSGNNTCAAALPSSNVCTQYGQGFC